MVNTSNKSDCTADARCFQRETTASSQAASDSETVFHVSYLRSLCATFTLPVSRIATTSAEIWRRLRGRLFNRIKGSLSCRLIIRTLLLIFYVSKERERPDEFRRTEVRLLIFHQAMNFILCSQVLVDIAPKAAIPCKSTERGTYLVHVWLLEAFVVFLLLFCFNFLSIFILIFYFEFFFWVHVCDLFVSSRRDLN